MFLTQFPYFTQIFIFLFIRIKSRGNQETKLHLDLQVQFIGIYSHFKFGATLCETHMTSYPYKTNDFLNPTSNMDKDYSKDTSLLSFLFQEISVAP